MRPLIRGITRSGLGPRYRAIRLIRRYSRSSLARPSPGLLLQPHLLLLRRLFTPSLLFLSSSRLQPHSSSSAHRPTHPPLSVLAIYCPPSSSSLRSFFPSSSLYDLLIYRLSLSTITSSLSYIYLPISSNISSSLTQTSFRDIRSVSSSSPSPSSSSSYSYSYVELTVSSRTPPPLDTFDTDSRVYPSPRPYRIMAVSVDDERLFRNAVFGFRNNFASSISHLPQSQRSELWSQFLSPYLDLSTDGPETGHSAPAPSLLDRKDTGSLEKSGKRTRQDTPRTILGSGLPMAKRQATVCD